MRCGQFDPFLVSLTFVMRCGQFDLCVVSLTFVMRCGQFDRCVVSLTFVMRCGQFDRCVLVDVWMFLSAHMKTWLTVEELNVVRLRSSPFYINMTQSLSL